MILSPQIQRAVDSCYECMLDQSAWPAAMQQLAEALGADAACLYAERIPQLRLKLPASPGYQAFLEEFIAGGWWATDHRSKRGWPRLRGGGRVLVEHDLVSEAERTSLPVYHELYAKHNLTWWAAVSFRVGQQDWAMPLLRREEKGPFGDTEVLLDVATHLCRIVGSAQEMLNSRARDAVELFEAGQRAAIVVDSFGRCRTVNALAEKILGSDLQISGGRLHAMDPASERALQDLISGALLARSRVELPSPVKILQRSQRPLIVDAVATFSSLGRLDLGLGVILLLTDLEGLETADTGELRRIFDLTAAETRLALHLLKGCSLTGASAALGLSKETTRTQLKGIFVKTRTNRQADLLRVLDRARQASTR